MLRQRPGFTLIELLSVIVIIGLLAAISIPKFGKTRERAYFKAMMADLRNLNTQQELYYTVPQNNYTYAPGVQHLPDFHTSKGVTVTIGDATGQGWSAVATHEALAATQECAMYMGTVDNPPAYVTTAGVVSCIGEQ